VAEDFFHIRELKTTKHAQHWELQIREVYIAYLMAYHKAPENHFHLKNSVAYLKHYPNKNINSNLEVTKMPRWGGMDWIDLAQDSGQWRALVNTAMNLRAPYNAGKFLSSCATGGFSRRAQLHGVS
jgi:hypothetical protein